MASSCTFVDPATPPKPRVAASTSTADSPRTPAPPHVMAARRRALTELGTNRNGARTRDELANIFALCLAGSPPTSPVSPTFPLNLANLIESASPTKAPAATSAAETERGEKRGRSRHVRRLTVNSPTPSTRKRTQRSVAKPIAKEAHEMEEDDDEQEALERILALTMGKKVSHRPSVLDIFA